MIDYRDDIVKKTLAATYKYGLRRVLDDDDNPDATIANNLVCLANTTNNDAFMHLWQVTFDVCHGHYHFVIISIY